MDTVHMENLNSRRQKSELIMAFVAVNGVEKADRVDVQHLIRGNRRTRAQQEGDTSCWMT